MLRVALPGGVSTGLGFEGEIAGIACPQTGGGRSCREVRGGAGGVVSPD